MATYHRHTHIQLLLETPKNTSVYSIVFTIVVDNSKSVNQKKNIKFRPVQIAK